MPAGSPRLRVSARTMFSRRDAETLRVCLQHPSPQEPSHVLSRNAFACPVPHSHWIHFDLETQR